MGRKKTQGSNMKRKNKFKDCPDKSHYEEFGEAHPLEDRTNVKRIKVEDTDESEKENPSSDDDMSSDEDQEDTDAVSRLLATFNTNANTAIDSDDDEEEDDDDDDDDDDDEEKVDDDGAADEEVDSDLDDVADGILSSDDNGGLVEGSSEQEEESGCDDQQLEESLKAGKNQEGKAGKNQKGKAEKNQKGKAEKNHKAPLKECKTEEEAEDDDDTLQDMEDPFRKHFALNIPDDIAEEVQKSDSWTSSFEEWPVLKRLKMEIPKVEAKQPKLLLLAEEKEENESPNLGVVPKPPRRKNFNLDNYHILQPLKENIPLINESSASCPSGFTETQKELFAVMSNYSDLYFPQANYERFEEMKTVYAVHALNHILKTRKRILKHNSKMKKEQMKKVRGDTDQCFRDQGYTRPKVLILLPFKHSAYRVIEVMTSLLKSKNFEVFKQSRFREDYGPGDDRDPPTSLNRAEDFHEIFKGNSNEDFKIGLKLTRRSLKLYTDFYQSDIIIASALGLRSLMGSFNLGTAQTDFLTSIEVLIIDQADVFMMQNWEHVLVLMEVLNKPPHDIHKLNTDLTRIRMWTLNGHSSLYRQTILFSAAHIDHNRALVNKCKNFTGRVQVLNPVRDGSVQEVLVPAELVLVRVAGIRDPDSRFKFFVNEILPQYQANRRFGIMVYIPDYCDYVRLVKYLKEEGGVNFSCIDEYMAGEMPKLAKIRSVFFDGKRQFLLYTERFHFYRRYRIKGVRHVIFYDLPTYPHFFSEICNLMVEGNQNRRTQKKHIGSSTVSVLYQQSDITKLVGVVGSQRAGEIIKAKKSIHICVIGS